MYRVTWMLLMFSLSGCVSANRTSIEVGEVSTPVFEAKNVRIIRESFLLKESNYGQEYQYVNHR